MRIVCQRVSSADVQVNGLQTGRIGNGLLVYLSVGSTDTEDDAKYIAQKIAHLRIFPDDAGKMNKSVLDAGGEILLISNFTLHGDCRKGRRPGFDTAADAETANKLYEKTAEILTELGLHVEKGVFAAHMHVCSVNNGPVTVMLDSTGLF